MLSAPKGSDVILPLVTSLHIGLDSGVARGGPGGPWPPPQTFVKCFFSAMNRCCYVEVARNCKKMSRN